MAREAVRKPLDAVDPDAGVPFPYIANTAGWMTAELGRQPWLVYGLMRTDRRLFDHCLGRQRHVHAARLHGHVHGALAILFLFLVQREIEHGPA